MLYLANGFIHGIRRRLEDVDKREVRWKVTVDEIMVEIEITINEMN